MAHFNYANNTSYPQTSISYTYDAADRVTKLVDTGGGSPSSSGNTQVIGYDLLDNLTSEQAPEGTVSYTYPKWIIPGSMTAPGQPKANYSFDANNRLTNVTQSSPGTLAEAVPTYRKIVTVTCTKLFSSLQARRLRQDSHQRSPV